MKRFLKSLAAAAIAASAFAEGLDVEVAANAGAYAISRSSTISWKINDGAEKDQSTAWTTSGFLPSYGVDVRGIYCVTDGLYLGLSLGFNHELAFAKKFKQSLNSGDSKDKEVEADSQTGTSYYGVPIKLVVKYDFNDVVMAESNFYLTGRGGIMYAINANKKALKTTNRDETEIVGLSGVKEHTIGLMNLVFDLGVGIEYRNAQFELGWAYKSVGTTGDADEISNPGDGGAERKTDATSAYTSNTVYASLGYRFKDLV